MLNLVPLSYSPEAEEPKGAARSVALLPEKTVPSGLSKRPSDKIMLPTMDGYCFEKIKQIAFLEAGGNYTTLHFMDKRQVLVCKTLREVEMMLPEASFIRIHRSHTVHLRHLKKYTRGKGGQVLLQNGTVLAVSAGQREALMEALKNYFG